MLNQKNTLALSILVVVLGMMGCQKTDPKNTDKSVDQTATSQVVDTSMLLQGDTEKLKFTLPECSGNSCPEFSVDRLHSNQPFVDEIIDQAILSNLDRILDVAQVNKSKKDFEQNQSSASEIQENASKTSAQQMQDRVQPYVNSFLELQKELQNLGASGQLSLTISPKILNAELPLATVVLNSSSFLGGAHGSSAQTYFNFDLKTKKQVELDQILQENQKDKLKQLAHGAFKVWVIDSKLAENVAEYEQAWKFKLTDNFYLGKQGLILQYGEYDIGPYVVGLPRLTIPYSQLKGVLKPQYFPAEMQVDQPASSVVANAKAAS
ncbi:RsiV family protein [Acinetobacter sp. P8-3-8]|uniref:RsiV family protein n=1 Tax=Acinetobacter sp. P8-3-8 TaxID=1029823 RepID=UPI0002485578|nr:RsiV family protein [Acinetobacter sp. P8-3-8]